MSLKRKITFMISIMLIVMLLFSIQAIYHQSSRILNEEAEQSMKAQLERANENVSLLLKSIVLETENLSLHTNVRSYFMGELEQDKSDQFLKKLMAEKNETRPVYMDLFLVDDKGIIVSAAMDEAVGVNVGDRDYYTNTVEQKHTTTSDVLFSRADQTQIVITLTPTYDENRQVVGYTGIAIYAIYFSDFLRAFEFNDESKYVIIDSYNRIVSHPNLARISTAFDTLEIDELDREEEASAYMLADIDGTENIIMQRALDFKKWCIISYLKKEAIYAKSRELSYTMIQIGCVFVIVSIILGVYITRIVSRPIVEITETLNRIIEEEATYKTTMIHNLSLERLDQSELLKDQTQELREFSNFRKAIQGLKDILVEGAQNFDVEYNALKKYIDAMYDELENINLRNMDFISTLSHDMRTPLTLIKGYASGLESGTVQDPEMEKKFKRGIVKSANDIENLIYNVLDFAYEIGDNATVNRKSYELTNAIEQIVFEIKQLYSDLERDITYDIDPLESFDNMTIALDLMNIQRVVVNLLGNSMKYSEATDQIIFSIKAIPNGALFKVYDEGQGIKESEIAKITDMFYRTEASKDKKGYGLGLYICDQILKAHGLQLEVESEYKTYTRVWFEVVCECV